MAYSVIPLVTTGDNWTAAQHNLYIRDNFAETMPDVISTRGDMVIGSGSHAISRFPFTANSLITAGSAAHGTLAAGDPFHSIRVNVAGDGLEWGVNPFVGEVMNETFYGNFQTIASGSDFAIIWGGTPQVGEFTFWSAANPARLTIPSNFPDARWYTVLAYVYWQNVSYDGTDTGLREISVAKNGVIQQGMTICNGRESEPYHMSLDVDMQLSKNDYIQIYVRHAYGSSINIYDPVLAIFLQR